jgi:hypothetical protein
MDAAACFVEADSIDRRGLVLALDVRIERCQAASMVTRRLLRSSVT